VAQLGSYNPHTKTVVLDKEATQKYLNNGAQPSSRVARVLKEQGIKLPNWVKEPVMKTKKAKHADKLRKNQPKEEPVAEEAPAEEVAAEAPAEEVAAEAPAEEAPAETPAEA
jgi:small subunit ribosomal protein S16